MRYILFNVSRLNKVLISRWWITKAVPHHISPLWAINNVQHRYDTYQAGDQSFIHSKPLRRTKRHVGEILCRAVSLSTSLVKIYCGALWLLCEWWGTQLQSGTWQPNEVSPVLPPFFWLWKLKESNVGDCKDHSCNWTKCRTHSKGVLEHCWSWTRNDRLCDIRALSCQCRRPAHLCCL